MMVVKANKAADGIGGHLSTYASSASLYEIGFNHFFRGKDDGTLGDQIYFQGHAAPGIYARAFLEGRLEAEDLDHFRREIGRNGRGLSSYPHPRLMPDFWEFPTVSMGLGPITALYQARYNRYLHARQLADTSQSRVWAFVGDGECDEPETLGALGLASREHLDNLIFVVNCNLQRLDGPVRGNGKIIQELEAVFRGAGWNVIKVILGSKWDELLAADKDGVLLNKLNTTVDGEFQRYSTESGDYIRDHFFGPDPRLREMVAHLSDEDLVNLPRGGHDYRKLYAAYKAATENLGSGAPTAILCKTIKGWTLGPDIEGRNATHQIKKMNKEQLLRLRDRLYLHDEIPESALDGDAAPYFRPAEDSIEYQYMMERRRALGGSIPKRVVRYRKPAPAARRRRLRRAAQGVRRPGRVDDDGVHPAAAQHVPRRRVRQVRRADHPRRGAHVRHGLVVPAAEDLRLAGTAVRAGRPRPAAQLRRVEDRADPRGGDHRGRFDGELHRRRHGLRHARHPDRAVLHVLFDVRLPARRRPHLAGRRLPDPRVPPRRHGRTHDAARRGPAAPGRALARARVDGAGVPGLRPGVRLRGGDDRASRGCSGCTATAARTRRDPDVFYYLTLYNENYPMPPMPEHVSARRRDARAVPAGPSAPRVRAGRRRCCSPAPPRVPPWRLPRSWRRTGTSASSCGRRRRTRRCATRRCAPSGGTGCTRARSHAYRSSPSCCGDAATTPIVAVTDFMKIVPEQIARFVPGRLFVPLGTDGMGRSDTREALRRHFETDTGHVVVGVLSALAAHGSVDSRRRRQGDRPLRHRRRPPRPTRPVGPESTAAVHAASPPRTRQIRRLRRLRLAVSAIAWVAGVRLRRLVLGVAIDAHVDVVGDRVGDLLGEVPEQAGAAGEQGDAANHTARHVDVGEHGAAHAGAVERQRLAEDLLVSPADRREQLEMRAEAAVVAGELRQRRACAGPRACAPDDRDRERSGRPPSSPATASMATSSQPSSSTGSGVEIGDDIAEVAGGVLSDAEEARPPSEQAGGQGALDRLGRAEQRDPGGDRRRREAVIGEGDEHRLEHRALLARSAGAW